MLQSLLASIRVLAIIIVTFARMTFHVRRPPQGSWPGRSRRKRFVAGGRSRALSDVLTRLSET